MLKQQEGDMEQEKEQEKEKAKHSEYAPQNRLKERVTGLVPSPFAGETKDQICEDLQNLFKKHQKKFFGVKDKESRDHINLQELRDQFRDFENLIDAYDNSDQNKEYQLFNMLISVTPRGEMFIGKHGTGLMTSIEFDRVI